MIKIICIGKLKEYYLKEGINDYLNRINKYHFLLIDNYNIHNSYNFIWFN